MPERFFFYAWFVLENCFVHFFIFDFLLCVTNRNSWNYLPVWLLGNGLITWLVTRFQVPGTFVWDVLVLFVFSRTALKIRCADLIAPAAIIFTFYTFAEGYSAFILSWLSVHFHSPSGGIMEQIFVPLFWDVLFFFGLRTVKRKYSDTLRQSISACLYVLLFPCAMIVLLIRYGLRLDSRDFARHLSSFNISIRLAALLTMLAAVIMVFMMIKVFCRIIQLTQYEKTTALLQSQLKGQKIYIAEARKRNEFYASFQHDIDNHLLVISGLLRDKLFTQAERYAEKLRIRSAAAPFQSVSTGNPALDVLLREKISFAKQNHITVTLDVTIPDSFCADDMDLCVLFSNILDNAIAACMEKGREERFLSLSAKIKAPFLIIEAVNTTNAVKAVPFGTGLTNILRTAEQYHGTMETELKNGKFRISVLLCSR